MRHQSLLPALVALVVLPLSACSAASGTGTLARLQTIAVTCPKDLKVGGYAALDVSTTGRSDSLQAERLRETRALATLTAVCGGHFEAVVFSASSAATKILYQGDLQPPGATENARLLRVARLVDAVMTAVTEQLPAAMAGLPGGGSDILSQFDLMNQYIMQLGTGFQLRAGIFTDGVATAGVGITNSPDFTAVVASDLASRVAVPVLRGSIITLAGIGRVASGPPAPSSYVGALTDFYRKVCDRTQAICTVVTNELTGGY